MLKMMTKNKTKTNKNMRSKMKAGNNDMMNNLPQDIYDSASDFGVFMALIGLISAVFFGVIMIIIALYLIFDRGTHSSEINAEVVNSKCDMYKDSKNKMHKECNTEIKYTVENKEYVNTVVTQTIQANGAKVNIVYNPSNPGDSLFKTGWRKIGAYILLATALFIIVAASIRYYIVKNFKIAAAATGIGEGAAMVAAPFQSSFVDSSVDP